LGCGGGAKLSEAREYPVRIGSILPLLPVLTFALLATFLSLNGKTTSSPVWFTQAVTLADAVSSKGISWLSSLPATCDPRLLFSSLFLLAGIGESLALSLVRIWTIICGAGVVYLLAHQHLGSGRFDRAAAWFLAVSPVWALGAANGDPYIILGGLFLLLSRFRLPIWLRVILVAWAISWSNWAWISLLILLLDRSNKSSESKIGKVGQILLAIIFLWIISPMALFKPMVWLSEIQQQILNDGFWSSGAHVGTGTGWRPITGTFHFAGLGLLLISSYHWMKRVRQLELAPIVFILVLALGSRSSYTADSALLLVMPWAAGEVGRGWDRLQKLLSRPFGQFGTSILLILLLIPLMIGCYKMPLPPVQKQNHQVEAARWLESNLPAGSLVAFDIGFSPPAESSLIWLSIPFHALEPASQSAAHWPGWYQSASAFVVSERLVIRFLKDPFNSRRILDFYKFITDHATGDLPFGETVERRIRVLTATPDPDHPLRPGWRKHIAHGQATGLSGDFIATLGLSLHECGQSEAAITLLEEAIMAGYQNIGIYINLANAFQGIGRLGEAGRVLDEGYLKFVDSPELMYSLGTVLVAGERWKRAAGILAKLHLKWPKSAQVSLMLSVAMINDGHPVAGLKQLEKTLTLDPTLEERAEVNRLILTISSEQ